MVLKNVVRANFILFETSLVLKKDKCSSVENTLVLKFDKAILKNNRMLQQSKVKS